VKLTTGADHRSEGRANVFLAAVLQDRGSSTAVRIRNLSGSGALVDGPSLPPVGARVRLVRGHLQAAGEVAWSSPSQAGISFERLINVNAWVKRPGHASRQRVDDIVTAFRGQHRGSFVLQDTGDPPSIRCITASLEQLCERLSAKPNMSIEFGEELLKLDSIAHDLKRLCGNEPQELT
jgi:hypothetical protein